jgi:hypothetical protein
MARIDKGAVERLANAAHTVFEHRLAIALRALRAALDAAEAHERAAVAEERERCLNLVPDGSDEWYENLRPVHVKRMLAVLRAAIRQEPVMADRVLVWRGDVLTEQTDPATLLEVIAHLGDETDALRQRLSERLAR